mmetsp:Transcript_20208/g.63367  ORF Transcript_20208/g.63367 Transcript_20208/m.63367 type:complete len:363 (-) Transcript_20208:639-1727(-)
MARVAAERHGLGGGERHDVAYVHQRRKHLRGVLQGLAAGEARADLLQGRASPSVDDGNPVLGGPRKDHFPLPTDPHALHELRLQRSEARQEDLVEAQHAGLGAAEAAQRPRAPVLQPEDRLCASGCLPQPPQDAQDFVQLHRSAGQGREDGEDGSGAWLDSLEHRQGVGRNQVLLLPLGDLGKQLLCVGIGPEMLPHGLQQSVHLVYQPPLQLLLGDLTAEEGLLEVAEAGVRLTVHGERVARPGEEDVLGVVQTGVHQVVLHQMHLVVCSLLGARLWLRWAVRVVDLPLHILRRVLHEDRAVGVRLRHLGLARFQPVEHVVGQDHRLHLPAGPVAVVACEHVDLALVHTELADVSLKEENV